MASSGSQLDSKRRKLNYAVEEESDGCSSENFSCNFCSAVFVTQISCSRHVLAFHEGQTVEKQEHVVKEGLVEEAQHNNFEELGNRYFDNKEQYYHKEEGNGHNGGVDLEDFGDPILNANEFTGIQNGLNGTNAPTSCLSRLRPRKDLASVLAQVEEITSVTEKDFVTCSSCWKRLERKELPIHVACEHAVAKFTCPYCGRKLSRKDYLKRHITNFHPEMCTETEICPFPRNPNLSRSTTNDFEGNDGLSQNIGYSEDGQEENKDKSNQITVEPDPPFQNLSDNNEDRYHNPRSQLDFLDQYQNNVSAMSGGNFQETIAENMAYKCNLCNADFSSKDLLRRHESSGHSGLRPHKCSICNKGYLRKDHLNKHTSSVHLGIQFVCEFCGKELCRRDLLTRHIKQIHPTQFNSLPQDAEQDLYTQAQLQMQLQTSALKTDQSRQPKSKASFFNCDMCEENFMNVDDLHSHQSIMHSHNVRKYKCNSCCKAFKRKEHLTRHEVLHTGERKFICLVCGNKYFRKDALKEHVKRTHWMDTNGSGTPSVNGSNGPISAIPCNLCDQLFQDRDSLLSHMTSFHRLIASSVPGLPKHSQPTVAIEAAPQQKQIQSKRTLTTGTGNGAGTKSVPPSTVEIGDT